MISPVYAGDPKNKVPMMGCYIARPGICTLLTKQELVAEHATKQAQIVEAKRRREQRVARGREYLAQR